MKVLRKIIEIDETLCDGCGQCVPACEEGAIQIIDGKARVVAEKYCDGLGACLGECPQGAISIVERVAEDFDPEAVEAYLETLDQHPQPVRQTLACGCPSTHLQTFEPKTSCQAANQPQSQTAGHSALGHWPIQIKLIPPHAPFLQQADLLVLADCAAVAYAALHQELLKGRVVMMGCPKFDDVPEYVEKFTEIFRKNDINSVTAVTMEVPCCSGLPMMVKNGMAAAGKKLPVTMLVIGTNGTLMKKEVL
ncbi:MAG: 4Fe-4S binding protein [Deltaproteobacteria bacterium]|nr:4Fe-4S binding protein [Candidatus Anaeroferrophillus wilburensis]MBN2887872.1 4Fe-4S binding protein [Deltaproteobacteria bacterium]